jgi:hypothetical protein
MPLTESEWRRNQIAMSQLKKQATTNHGNESGCTTVNPRERPKGNLNNLNSIILPPSSNSNNSNTSINNSISVKTRTHSNTPPFVNVVAPPVSTFPSNSSNSNVFANNNSNSLLGFDDDFNSAPIQAHTNLNSNISRSPMNTSTNTINTNNKSPLLLPAPNERKGHRRSASQ